jgi:hypothetical protein
MASYLPTYSVVDTSQLNTYPLTTDQTGTFPTAQRFTTNSSENNSAQMTAYPVGTAYNTSDQAKTWFSTTDSKTSLLILESLYYQ